MFEKSDVYCVWPGEWFHSWQSVVIRWRGAALGWNPRRRLCSFHSHVIYYSVFIIQCTSFWTVVPAPTCGTTFCSTLHLHSHSRSSDSVSRLSSSLVPTWTCWYDLLIISDYCRFSFILLFPVDLAITDIIYSTLNMSMSRWWWWRWWWCSNKNFCCTSFSNPQAAQHSLRGGIVFTCLSRCLSRDVSISFACKNTERMLMKMSVE